MKEQLDFLPLVIEDKFNEAIEYYERVHREEVRLIRETYKKAVEVNLVNCETWEEFVGRMRSNIEGSEKKEATLRLIASSLACETARTEVEDAWRAVEKMDMTEAVETLNQRIRSTVVINLLTEKQRKALVTQGEFVDKERRVVLDAKYGIIVELLPPVDTQDE